MFYYPHYRKLNSNSSLRYDANFSEKSRNVFLEGEAYFDVFHNPQMSFIVHASDLDVKVLGTAFNVKSYAKDKSVETTLLRGKVVIENSAFYIPVFLEELNSSAQKKEAVILHDSLLFIDTCFINP